MKLFQTLFLLAGAFLGSLVSAAGESVFPVLPLKEAPVSAEWEAPVWNEIPAGTGFLGLKSKQLSTQRQTLFKMGWCQDTLYVLVKCLEPEPDKIKTDKNNYRDGWYPDDHVEFFVCSSRDLSKKVYKQFVVNGNSGRWCNFTSLGNSTEWNACAAKGKNAWTVLMRIPFSVIIPSGKSKSDLLYFNLGRVANGNTEKTDIHSCFAPVVSGFSNLSAFIPMQITTKPLQITTSTFCKDFDRLDAWSRAKLWKMAYVKESFLSGRENAPETASLLKIKQEAKAVLKEKNIDKALALIGEYEKYSEELARPVKRSIVKAETKNARIKLFMDGKEVPLDASGKADITMQEGFAVLDAECSATGAEPGVKIQFLSCPEADGRWKIASGVSDRKGIVPIYSDASWKVPASRDGFLWSADAKEQKICMRQVLLYNGGHDGPNRCINPLVKEWGFSLDSTEPLFLMLYSPLKGLSADYEFVLDLPEGFRLLDLKNDHQDGWWGPKVKMNCSPESVTSTVIVDHGKKYTRNVIRFAAEDIRDDQTISCILPVKLDSTRKAGEKTSFRFSRRIAGMFTEVVQTLPVKVLPKINGCMASRFRLSMYCSVPYFGGHVSCEALKAFLDTAMDAGFNDWTCGGNIPNKPDPYWDLFLETLKNRNARLTGHYFNYPAWRGSLLWTELRRYTDSTPEAKARYFNDMPAVVSVRSDLSKITKNENATAMYCPLYMTTKGRDAFVDLVAKDIGKLMAGLKGQDATFWVNWESEPWQAGNTYVQARTGLGSYCFCDRCKAAFAKFIGLPDGTKLSDEEIFNKHYKEWASFRYKLDGEIQSLITEAVHKLGHEYMVYSWITQEQFWEACNGRVDIAFPGCPGNAPADASNQPLMDHAAQFLREKAHFKRIVGQRFSFFGPYYSQGSHAWKSYNVMSNSGYIEAATWKNQVLRVAATMGGGLDLQSSLECIAGMMYYIGEATRAINDYEDLFLNGKREDSLAVSKEIKYPNLLVLTKGSERLVLLFNESAKPLTVQLENKSLVSGQTAEIWENPEKIADASKMTVTVPANDTVLVHIK